MSIWRVQEEVGVDGGCSESRGRDSGKSVGSGTEGVGTAVMVNFGEAEEQIGRVTRTLGK